MIAGVLALLTAGMLACYALVNLGYAVDGPAGRWTGLLLQNVLGGLIGAGALLVAAGFTFARRIPGAWTLCGLCLLYLVATLFVAPLLRGTPLGAQLRYVFGFDGGDGIAIALVVVFGFPTAIAAAIAGSVKSYGPGRRSASALPGVQGPDRYLPGHRPR
ncbi:hypothetical protein BJF79_02120 [Actinomadura sp. CNU-125]|nr:hypothetical protein BJF79_02120 [Actinomadura sp. CNU-125]